MRLQLADSHCHLNWRDFDGDRTEVVLRAGEGGVVMILNPGTDLETSREAVELAQKFDQVVAAVGVHPNEAEGFGPESIDRLRELARNPKVVAIGEAGMDFHWDKFPVERQREVFESQIALAGELELPIIVHDRNAHADILETLDNAARASRRPRGVVMHSFSGGLPEARRALEAGAYLGVSGPVTYKKSDDLRAVVKWAPLDRLLIETDSPYLAPQQHRGKRNEPAYVRLVAERVSELKGLPLETVAEITLANARHVFAIGEVS